MSSAQAILAAREMRHNKVVEMAKRDNIVTIKANIVGQDKNIGESNLLVYIFARLMREYCKDMIFDLGDDGVAIIATTDRDVKSIATQLETTHKLGRFIDIDVTLKGETRSLTRGSMRKCYICDDYAFVCGRTNKHSANQLLAKLTQSVREYFTQELATIIKDSMMAELNLQDKFGLVSRSSNGSHKDMDYATMQASQDVIIPYLIQMFWKGFEQGDGDLLAAIRPIGIAAEQEMLSAANVNTYKGLIFVLGALLSAIGVALSGVGKQIDTITSKMCGGMINELDTATTFGAYAYKEYGIGGVRQQASLGFPAVIQIEQSITDMSDNTLLKALAQTVGKIDDTVLLKRSGSLTRYNYFKQKISSIDVDNALAVKELNDECLDNNISIGGSADILIASIMLNKLKKIVSIDFTAQ